MFHNRGTFIAVNLTIITLILVAGRVETLTYVKKYTFDYPNNLCQSAFEKSES